MHRRKYLQYGKAPTEPKALTKHIIGYLLSLGQLSYSYRNVAMSAIKHYYNSLDDDIILNWDKIATPAGIESEVTTKKLFLWRVKYVVICKFISKFMRLSV